MEISSRDFASIVTADHALESKRIQLQPIRTIIKDVVSANLEYAGYSMQPGADETQAIFKLSRKQRVGTKTYLHWSGDYFNKTFAERLNPATWPAISPSFLNSYSLYFDGINDFLTFGNAFNYDNANQWSLSMWIRPDNLAARHTLFSKTTNDANVYGWGFYQDTGGQLFIQMRAPAQLRQHTSVLTFNALAWNHLCITYDGSQNINGLRIYINGVLGAVPASGAVTASLLSGQDAMLASRNGAFQYPGYMDEVAIIGKELSALEVAEIYNAGSPPDYSLLSFIGNIASYYRMGDGDTYPTILDQVSTVNGTMTNMTPAQITGVVP